MALEAIDLGLVGATIADRYEILERIGRGGMGDVYRALDRELDEPVALKVVRDHVLRVPGVVERFRAEVKLARRVTHRNVARTFELGSADGLVYFTMELIEGGSLAACLEQGPLSTAQAIAIAADLCDALGAAHAVGVVHRDLKPDNVLLALDGRTVLTDFGIASLGRGDDGSGGTPRYMAPEQARGEVPTPAVDLYALGLVLYEMVCGTPAFAGSLGTVLEAKQDPGRLPPQLAAIEPVVRAVIARAIAFDPDARWPSAAALREALAPAGAAPVTGTRARRSTSHGLPTVQVLPIAAPRELAAHALGFHDELLRRLTRRSHLRVLRGRRRDLLDGAWIEVVATPGPGLTVTMRLAGRDERIDLSCGLEVDALVGAADLTSRVVSAAIGAGPERGSDEPPLSAAVRLHLWRGAERIRHDETERLAASADFIAAAAIAPDHPRVMAAMAMSETRAAFFANAPDAAMLARATELATRAVTIAPHSAEAHVAYGRVLLHHADSAGAASHFRAAIARAPFLTEPHEFLGRMLLESGFLDDGVARMRDVLDMDPELELPQWDLARAHALEGRWDEHDRIVAALRPTTGPSNRLAAELRTAGWRRDLTTMARIRAETETAPGVPMFERALITAVCDAAMSQSWPTMRDGIVAAARATPSVVGSRRRAFVGQIIAEVAGASGDVDTAIAMLAMSVESGLFDRHWLEKCPLLEPVRHDLRYASLHAVVWGRAHAILDAMYGDHAHRGTADTLLVAARPRA